MNKMNQTNGKDVISAIHQSAEELHERIDMHRRLVASALENRVNDEMVWGFSKFQARRSREAQLKQAIMEAIDVLEESRKAFKSKRLEALRKRLTVVLID